MARLVRPASTLEAAQGILRPVDNHSAKRVDGVYQNVLAVGDPSYHVLEGILAAGAENPHGPTLPRASDRSHGAATRAGRAVSNLR